MLRQIINGRMECKNCKKKEGEFSLGNYGYGRRNERGDRLIEFAECEQEYIMNLFIFKKKPQKNCRWRSANRATNETDYIMTSDKQKTSNVGLQRSQ